MDRLRAWAVEELVRRWTAAGAGTVRTMVPPPEGPLSSGWVPAAIWNSGPGGCGRFDPGADERLGTPDSVIVGQPFDGRSGLSTTIEAKDAAVRRWPTAQGFIRLMPEGPDPSITQVAEELGVETVDVVGLAPTPSLSEDEMVDLYRASLGGVDGSWKEVPVVRRRIDLLVVPDPSETVVQEVKHQPLEPLMPILKHATLIEVIEAKKRLDGDVIGQALSGARQLENLI